MTLLTIDIETIPNEDLLPNALRAMPPPSPEDAPRNYKDPDAIAKWVREAASGHQEKVIKRMSTDPILGRICSVAMLNIDDLDGRLMPEVITINKSNPIVNEERYLLREVAARLTLSSRQLTFNGTNFDLPFIAKRCRILGIPYTAPSLEAHIDLMRETSTRTYTGGYDNKSLDELRAWFGIKRTTDHTGADVYADYLRGDTSVIASHNLDDVYATYLVAKELSLL